MVFDVIKTKKIWFALSGLLIGGSIIALAVFGLRMGIDFTGGSLMTVQFENAPTTDAVRSSIVSFGYEGTRVQSTEGGAFIVRLPSLAEEEHQAVLSNLEAQFGAFEEQQYQLVGPVFGAELLKKAIWAIVLVLTLITLYVTYVFRKVSDPVASWKYGVITMIAAFHDIIIPIGLFAILGYFLNYQIDSAFVAAILTVLGYSINDTIIVFDRVRENLMHRSSAESLEETVSKSVRQTAVRSINTSVTTLLALFAILFFGGETTRAFALALIVGIISGTYSSIFIASPLLIVWEKWSRKA
ncbi:MAG: protein translocase subunit SecF [Patescibacteria group bacterium]